MESTFASTAIKLSRNPLGIIALFIVLVYAIAGTIFSTSAQTYERVILLVFLVLFPLIVFAAFYVLVTQHHDKLYAPSDFSSDKHFVELIEKRIASSPTVRRLDESVADLQNVERANVLMYQALGLCDEGNYSGALHYLDEALKEHPKYLIALVKKSACLKRLNKVAEALKIVDDVLGLEPNLEVALFNRACYRALLKYPKADILADLKRAIALFPDNKRFAMNDPDLASLQDDQEFRNLMQ